MFKVNNRNFKKKYSKLTIETPERRDWRRSDVFIVNFEHISQFFFGVSILKLTEVSLLGSFF